MNKRRVEKFIPLAIKCIEQVSEINKGLPAKQDKKDDITKNQDDTIIIPKEFNGYIANFGASIVQSGLLSTVAFFENTDSGADKNRKTIVDLIFNIIEKYENKEEIDYKADCSLFKYVMKNKNKKNIIKEKIIDAVIALKLAARVFEFSADEIE